jgi:hypothetical protein
VKYLSPHRDDSPGGQGFAVRSFARCQGDPRPDTPEKTLSGQPATEATEKPSPPIRFVPIEALRSVARNLSTGRPQAIAVVLGIGPGHFVVGSVGSLVGCKGHGVLMEGFAQAMKVILKSLCIPA